MQGKIVKGISGFYYVHVGEPGIYECKAKGAFRNQKINRWSEMMWRLRLLTKKQKKETLKKSCRGKMKLIRPAVANIDLALIIFAAAKPQPNLIC